MNIDDLKDAWNGDEQNAEHNSLPLSNALSSKTTSATASSSARLILCWSITPDEESFLHDENDIAARAVIKIIILVFIQSDFNF